MIWSDRASPNIALIKYMGKTDASANAPLNASLSYTLNDLWTEVELEYSTASTRDVWQAFAQDTDVFLSAHEQERFLKQLWRVREHFDFFSGSFIVRSRNNFPRSCGIASSASSFAAMTKTAARAISELTKKTPLTTIEMAQLSRAGSGSSGRSFFSPWALWKDLEIQGIDLYYANLNHVVAVVSGEQKPVSSSSAHGRVTTSALMIGRKERAEARLTQLLEAFSTQNWREAFELCWAECFDMHALFLTSQPAFNLMQPGSLLIADWVRGQWEKKGDGPLFTMDAGPNVHLLYRDDQMSLLKDFESEFNQQMPLLRGSSAKGIRS